MKTQWKSVITTSLTEREEEKRRALLTTLFLSTLSSLAVAITLRIYSYPLKEKTTKQIERMTIKEKQTGEEKTEQEMVNRYEFDYFYVYYF